MVKEPDNDIPSIAESMIQKGNRTEAEIILKNFVSKMTSDWKPMTRSSTTIDIAYWSMEEFLHHTTYFAQNTDQTTVVWKAPSYSKALYLLAFIYVEREDWLKAMMYIDRAIKLEPDHPLILCEKALILSRLAYHQDAYDLFMKAFEARPWVPQPQQARALRGAAIALIDLKRLDEAEALLKRSLEIEPENKVALDELGYTEALRKGGKPSDKYDLH